MLSLLPYKLGSRIAFESKENPPEYANILGLLLDNIIKIS